MKKYKVEKMVEQLFINSIIYKNIDYEITDNTNTYIIHNLKAEIEDDVVWFLHCELDFMIESLQDIELKDDKIKIIFNDGSSDINIKMIK